MLLVQRARSYPRRARLRHALEYQRVREARLRKSRGPLLVSGVANGLGRCRLGLAVGRRAGGAVARNRYKRLIREGFRLARSELDAVGPAIDLVVSVRGHDTLKPEAYRDLLLEASRGIRRELGKRARRADGRTDHGGRP